MLWRLELQEEIEYIVFYRVGTIQRFAFLQRDFKTIKGAILYCKTHKIKVYAIYIKCKEGSYSFSNYKYNRGYMQMKKLEKRGDEIMCTGCILYKNSRRYCTNIEYWKSKNEIQTDYLLAKGKGCIYKVVK